MKPYDKYRDAKKRYRTRIILVYHKDNYLTYAEDAKILHQTSNLQPTPKNKHKIKIPYDNIVPLLKNLIQHHHKVGLIEPSNIELKRRNII